MKITLNNTKGKILKTAKTVIREDIEVVPALEKKKIYANGNYTVGDGYAGIGEVVVAVPKGEGEVIPDHTQSDFTLQLANIAPGELGVVYSSTEKVSFEAAPSGEVIDTFVDTNFLPNNIKKDVEIFGVTGIYEGEGEVIPEFTEVEGFDVFLDEADEGTITVAYSTPQDVKLPAPSGSAQAVRLASVSDEDFIADNIRKGKNIFGLEGAFEGEGGATPTQEKSVNITENGKTEVLPDAGFALSKVTINANVKQNYCLVRFYNDDRTTLLYEVLVPYGSSAVYAGDAPVSSLGADYTFTGFEPSTANVTADMDCYAVYEEPTFAIGTLEETSWADISTVSADGTAANYFAVGDTKAVTLNGNVGAGLTLNNATYYVYIIGFDHNSELEGNGIHFGTFKTADGTDICLVDNEYSHKSINGTKQFNLHHWGDKTYGGWKGCDLRYDVLGSTDVAPSGYGALITSGRVGYDATATCATNPVADTLMAALPSDLRAVMKPMTKYTDNTGDGGVADVTAAIDYLPLLAEYEVQGTQATGACPTEKTKQAQYAYYSAGNSKVKNRFENDTIYTAAWHTRSVYNGSGKYYVGIDNNGASFDSYASSSIGIAPIFKV